MRLRRLGAALAIVLLVIPFVGCSKSRGELPVESTATTPHEMRRDVCIRVVDVSNKTRELYDVDAIGMLWTAMDESLRDKGLLWQGNPSIPVLTLEAEIVKYQEGNIFLRPVLPMWGKAYLQARCTVKDGDRVVATAEAKDAISIGMEGFKTGAWRKVFKSVAKDLIDQIVKNL